MVSSSARRPVFVIEDDPDARDAIVLALQGEGYEAVGAGSSEDAVRAIRSHEVVPSLIVLDLMMPGMNGWQVREALMEQPETRNVPVIYVSGLRHSLDDLQAGAMRGVAAIAKPLDMDRLLAAVREHRAGR